MDDAVIIKYSIDLVVTQGNLPESPLLVDSRFDSFDNVCASG